MELGMHHELNNSTVGVGLVAGEEVGLSVCGIASLISRALRME